ncbi:hypothetical protein AB6D11_18770 [Vibrio splendidus]
MSNISPKPDQAADYSGDNYVEVFAPMQDMSTYRFQGKMHLAKPELNKVFCGTNARLWWLNDVTLDWVNQVDHHGEVCINCVTGAKQYFKDRENRDNADRR